MLLSHEERRADEGAVSIDSGALDERGRESGRHRKRWRSATQASPWCIERAGVVPSTIGKGIKELRERQDGETEPEERRRVRRPGGGRPSKTSEDPQLLGALESLVEPCTRVDPESALRWTCKSLRALAGNSLGWVTPSATGRLVEC